MGNAAADRKYFLMFQDAQQLCLNTERNVGELIQEDRSAGGKFQQPRFGLRSPGECAFLVPKEFTFDEVGIERGHVNRQKRLISSVTMPMQGPRHEFFSGARFAGDEHTGIVRRDQRDPFEYGLHRRAASDDVGIFFGCANVVCGGSWPFDGAGDGIESLRQIERFGQIFKRPALHRAHGRGEVAMSSDDNDGRIVRQLAQFAEGREAIHTGEPNVEDDGIGVMFGSEIKGRFRRGRDVDTVASAFKGFAKRPGDRFFVVHDEEGFGRHSCSRKKSHLPTASLAK